MKKIFVILIAILSGLQSSGQRGPIMPYGSYSKAQVKALAQGDSEKSKEFRSKLVAWVAGCLKDTLTINGSSIDFIFDHTESEEINLKADQYQNSGLTPTNKIQFFLGGNYEGYAGVMRIGSYKIILYKENCVNLLRVPNFKIKQKNPVVVIPPQPAKTIEAKKDDWHFEPIKEFAPVYNSLPIDLRIPPVVKKKRGPWLWILGAVAVPTIGYFLFYKKGDKGGPGGAPITPGPPRGPGGAPLTGG